MINGRTVTVDTILEELYRDYSFDNLNKGEVAEWVFKAMGLIGSPYPFEDKPAELTIENYRAELPVDLYSISAVREKTTGTNMREGTDLFGSFGLPAYAETQIVNTGALDNSGNPYQTVVGPEYSSEYYTFKTQGNYIYTGLKTGVIEMAYKAIPIDVVTGLPVIPDDVRYIRGVVSFVAERIAFRLFMKDLIQAQKYDLIRTEYFFNVGSAKSACYQLSPARMETLINRWKSTYLGPDHFNDGLAFVGSRE